MPRRAAALDLHQLTLFADEAPAEASQVESVPEPVPTPLADSAARA
jgi:hypothetical protein